MYNFGILNLYGFHFLYVCRNRKHEKARGERERDKERGEGGGWA